MCKKQILWRILEMTKKSYMSLLKEAIAEFDTSDNVEVKGPMLDPILSWDGNGELPVYKDAASILERYYFDEGKDAKIRTLDEADYENDNGNPASGPSMKNAEGDGTEQAGTSDAGTVKGGMDEKEKEIAKEAEEVEDGETDDEDEDDDKEMAEESLTMENAIIEKLISEMEDEDTDDDDDDDDDDDINESEGPEQHATGAGTEQAGTGDDEGQIPDRKDLHDDFTKPKKYTDENEKIEEALAALEAEMADDDDDEEEEDEEVEKDLDIDKEVAKESGVPGGPSPKKTGEDWEDDEKYYAEAFNIFKEEVEDDADDDDDDDDEKDAEEDLTEWGSSPAEQMKDAQEEKKQDIMAVRRKCLKYKELGQPEKVKPCVEKGIAQVNAHFAKVFADIKRSM